MPPLYAYLALIASAFTSATLLPGYIRGGIRRICVQYPQHALGACFVRRFWRMAWAVWFHDMGRMFPAKRKAVWKSIGAYTKMEIWPLLFAWLPIIGDALPFAGCSRLNALHCAIVWLQANCCCAMPWFVGNEHSCRISFHSQRMKGPSEWFRRPLPLVSTITRLSQYFRTGSRYCHR